MIKKIKISLLFILFSLMLLTVPAIAEPTQNEQLAQYYAILAQQGGNESISKEEAAKLAQYYASQSSSTTTTVAPTTGVQTGTQLCVVNVNASEKYYNTVIATLNTLPESLKQKIASHNVVFNLYDSASWFGGTFNTGGLTNTTMSYNNYYRECNFVVSLADRSAIKAKDFTIYHEVGHIVDYLVWESTGIRGASMNSWEYCMDLEGWTSRSLAGYTHPSTYYDEFFADAFAEYYLKTSKFQKKCPNMFVFFTTLAY